MNISPDVYDGLRTAVLDLGTDIFMERLLWHHKLQPVFPASDDVVDNLADRVDGFLDTHYDDLLFHFNQLT